MPLFSGRELLRLLPISRDLGIIILVRLPEPVQIVRARAAFVIRLS